MKTPRIHLWYWKLLFAFTGLAVGVAIGLRLPALIRARMVSSSVPAVSSVPAEWSLENVDRADAWKTYTDPKTHLTFQAPDVFEKAPTFETGDCSVFKQTMTAIAAKENPVSKTTCQKNGETPVCILEQSDAGMSQVWTAYTIVAAKGSVCGSVSATLHEVNECGPFDEPDRSQCQRYQDHVRAEILPRIFSSVSLP